MQKVFRFKNGNSLIIEGIHHIKLYYLENLASKERFTDYSGNVITSSVPNNEYFGLWGGYSRQLLDGSDIQKRPGPLLRRTSDLPEVITQPTLQSEMQIEDQYYTADMWSYKPKVADDIIHWVEAENDFIIMGVTIRKGEFYPEKIECFEPIGENPVKWVDFYHKVIMHVILKK